MDSGNRVRIGLLVAAIVFAAGLVSAAEPLAEARAGTAEFHNVDKALADGYMPDDHCVSNPVGDGAMGVHYANPALLGDGEVDPAEPEVLVYEPMRNGRMRLVAVEYVIQEREWDAESAPTLFGQKFHGPVSHGELPAQYELHAWAWKHNPDGMFAPFNPRVSCPAH